MSRDLDLSLYRAFITVAEEGGMTAAARRLHLTQAAISQQIRRLEEALNCQLFLRNHRNIQLSGFGEKLLPKARSIVKLSDEVWADMTAPPVIGEIRLGAPTDIVNTYLLMALRAFAKENPQVDITLVCLTSPKLEQAWLQNEVDIAIIEEPAGTLDQNESKECLLVDRMVWVGAKNGEAVNRSPLPVSLCNNTNALRPAMVRALKEQHINFRPISELGTIETVSATVRTDLAITALLQSTVPSDVDILNGRFPLPELPHFEVNMLGPKDADNFVAKVLCEKLREAFSN